MRAVAYTRLHLAASASSVVRRRSEAASADEAPASCGTAANVQLEAVPQPSRSLAAGIRPPQVALVEIEAGVGFSRPARDG
jgi:hypothetical protein